MIDLKTFNHQCFAFDTETDGLDWHTQIPKGISLYDGKNVIYITEEFENLLDLFLDAKTIIGHNLVYDFKVLMKIFGREKVNQILLSANLIDTQLAAYIIDPEQTRSLKNLTEKHFGQKRLRWEQAIRFGWDSPEFVQYAKQDAIDTWNLWPVLQKTLQERQQEQIFKIECDFIPVQIEMETTGILIDQKLLAKQEEELELMKCDLERRMCESLGLDVFLQGELFGGHTLLMPLHFASPKAVADYIQHKMHIELQLKTDKGSYSVGKKTIEQLLDRHPFFPIYQKYQAVRKLLTTYIRPYWNLMKPDGKIYPSFRHVRSGRCTSYNPNLQNLARINELVPEVNLRKLFIVGPDNKFLKTDYAGQELRILAHITGDTALIEAFQKGKDVHLDTANKIFNLGIPETDLYESSPNYKTWKKKYESKRYEAKAINFGIAYGKHSEYTEAWFRFYPGVKKMIYKCKDFQKEKGFTVTWAGRRRYYTTFRPTDLRSGFNMLIQGTGADMMKKAAGELWRYLQQFHVRIVLIVHDEIIIESPAETIEQLVEPTRRYMENTMKLAVPLVAEPKIVESYGE